ncbi:hypothetical protein EI94DRAFT_1707204 [Lactarius quietus]|nr:hypothetical protein EI94DRAFT_1707204 [Lactarius quietus]
MLVPISCLLHICIHSVNSSPETYRTPNQSPVQHLLAPEKVVENDYAVTLLWWMSSKARRVGWASKQWAVNNGCTRSTLLSLWTTIRWLDSVTTLADMQMSLHARKAFGNTAGSLVRAVSTSFAPTASTLHYSSTTPWADSSSHRGHPSRSGTLYKVASLGALNSDVFVFGCRVPDEITPKSDSLTVAENAEHQILGCVGAQRRSGAHSKMVFYGR